MYRLLIVDDEKEILEWLEEVFEENPIEGRSLEVYTAQSGSKALELLDKIRFDVVLSDIKMPGISGIELFKLMRCNWPKCKVVFLTGYRNFDYVYEVIQSQGVRYVLKTETDEIIIKNVEEAIIDIEEELNNKEVIRQAREQLEKHQLVIQKDYFNRLLEEESPLENLKGDMDVLNLALRPEQPMVMVVGRFDNLKVDMSCIKRYELYEQLKFIMEENLSKEWQVIQHIHDTYYGVWLFQSLGESSVWDKSIDRVMGLLEYVHRACNKKLDLKVSFALAQEKILINEMGYWYSKLKSRLVRHMKEDENDFLVCISEIDEDQKVLNINSNRQVAYKIESKVDLMEKCLELRKKQEYYDLLGDLFEGVQANQNNYYGINLEIYYNIAMMLLRFIHSNDLNTSIAFHLGIYKLTRIDEHKDWQTAVAYIYGISKVIFEILGEYELDKSTEVVDKVRRYIQKHLGEDLSLMRLAEYVHFNPSYLSRLFRQVSGYKLSEYITSQRIDEAKRLLNGDRYKVNEVAQKVGYESAHSFTRTFKAIEGVSPIEYKTLQVRGKDK